MTASHVIGTADVTNIEAPMTFRAYILCGFAALGGILFGFDSGYVSGILDMPFLIHLYTGIPIPGPDDSAATKADFKLPAWQDSLIISILSAGTFFGALIAGDMADFFGRRTTIIMGSIIYSIGVVLQVASSTLAVMVSGRLIAGLGVGFVSAIIILYMSEIAPRMVRGAIVSGYQFFITVGILLASCVDYATQNRHDSGAYRIPVALQLLWGIILGTGLFFLPESPRFYVKKGNLEKATLVLSSYVAKPSTLNSLSKRSLKFWLITSTKCLRRVSMDGSTRGLPASMVDSVVQVLIYTALFLGLRSR
ncbi:General substrate transporter [Trichoderma simmonsii]|uniref:General substrate transporter n=1 Tax=Trichoderma simmonsii TaxID=1491479 RepID=A0A8G0PG13_9HYPO|nr:General substrate transporter [Trichoderma simmonsii]